MNPLHYTSPQAQYRRFLEYQARAAAEARAKQAKEAEDCALLSQGVHALQWAAGEIVRLRDENDRLRDANDRLEGTIGIKRDEATPCPTQ